MLTSTDRYPATHLTGRSSSELPETSGVCDFNRMSGVRWLRSLDRTRDLGDAPGLAPAGALLLAATLAGTALVVQNDDHHVRFGCTQNSKGHSSSHQHKHLFQCFHRKTDVPYLYPAKRYISRFTGCITSICSDI